MNLKKQIMTLTLLLGLITSVSAVSYDFNPSTVDNSAPASNLEIAGLNQSTDYKLVRGDGTEIKSFSSSSTGVADISFTFEPLADDFNDLNGKGLIYELKSNGNTVKNIRLYPAYFNRFIDTFNDGEINNELFEASYNGRSYDSYIREGNNNIYSVKTSSYYPDKSMYSSINFKKNVDSSQAIIGKLGFNNQLEINYQRINIQGVGTINLPKNEKGAFKIEYDGPNNRFKVNVDGKSYEITNVGDIEDYSVKIEASAGNQYSDGTARAKINLYNWAVVPRSHAKYWNTSNSLRFSPESGIINLESFSGHLNYSTGVPEMKKVSESSYSTDITSFSSAEGIDIRTKTNSVIDYLAMNTEVVNPPKVSDVKFEPKEWRYRSDIDFEATVTDKDGVVDDVKYNVYVDGSKIAENRSMTQTDNPDVYESAEPVFIEEDGVDYTIEIVGTDNDGYKGSKEFTRSIKAFNTDFSFDELGTWSDEPITPNLNATGFSVSWDGYNSSLEETNYSYGRIMFVLDSLDRNKSVEYGYAEFTGNSDYVSGQQIEFKNQSLESDNADVTNGTAGYSINFQNLNDYDVTNNILGDELLVKQELRLFNDNGTVEKKIILQSNHESLEEQGGFFSAIFKGVGSALSSVGDFLGITDLIEGIQSFLEDSIGSITSTVSDLYNAVVDTLVGVLEGIIDAIWSGLEELYIALASLLAGIINAITLFFSFIINLIDLAIAPFMNYGLEVEGQLDKNNESFTYYNYTGDYDKRFNETNATTMDGITLSYSLNSTYTALEYADKQNYSATNFTESTISSLGNTAEIRGENVTGTNITINSYTTDYNFPEGISWPFMAVFFFSSLFMAIIGGIIALVPQPIMNGIEVVFKVGGTVLGIITQFIGYLTWALNFLFVDGLNWTIMLVKYYFIFKGVIWIKYIADGVSNGGRDTSEAVNLVLDDVKDLYMTTINLAETTFNIADKAFRQVMDILRTISSYIPFI